jgi:hypothetical protein
MGLLPDAESEYGHAVEGHLGFIRAAPEEVPCALGLDIGNLSEKLWELGGKGLPIVLEELLRGRSRLPTTLFPHR